LFFSASLIIASAQDAATGPGQPVDTQAYSVVYEAPVVYQAPVVYTAPVLYMAQVTYAAAAPVCDTAATAPVVVDPTIITQAVADVGQFSSPQVCRPVSTVTYIGSGGVGYQATRGSCASTVTVVGGGWYR
jgi:hypothetical protein